MLSLTAALLTCSAMVLTPIRTGAFAQDEAHMPELIARCQVVSDLHSRIAKCELISHRFDPDNWKIQESVFADGTKVTVDLENRLTPFLPDK